MADFNDENAPRSKVERRVRDDFPYEIEAVAAAGKRDPRFTPVLCRQCSHDGVAHVGRVGDDQIVAALREGCVEV